MRHLHQSEAAECGLACLTMIANHHGMRVDLAALRRRYPVSLKGATLKTVVATADHMGFSCRPIRAELEALDTLELPAILHWNLNHFVVLARVKGGKATLYDPARGKCVLKLEEVSKHFTGVALELRPSPSFHKTKNVKPVRLTDFWSRIKGLKRSMVQAFILSFILQLFALASPLYQQMVVDDAITKQDSDFLVVLAMGFALMGLINLAVTQLRAYVMLYFSNALGFQMTVNLFRHLLRLPLEFFEKRHVGDISSRFGSLAPIKELFTNGLVAAILDAIMAVGTLAMALLYSWKLTAVVVAFLALGFLIDLVVFPIRKRMNEDILVTGAAENTTFLETIRAARAIKIFGQEQAREALWQNKKVETINANLKLAKFGLRLGAATGVVGVGQNILTLYIGAHLVIDGELTLGMLFAYQSYSGQFAARMQALFGQIIELQMLKLHLTRLADIVHTETEIAPSETAQNPHMSLAGEVEAGQSTAPVYAIKKLQGQIDLIDVSFRYGEHEPWVLQNVTLHIDAGEMVSLVGPSGAGKSTLMKLLIGLLTPIRGEIRIDGDPLRILGPQIYRANLGVVMQDDQLLSGSIADNISFFDPDVDMQRVETAARLAYLDRDIATNPMGYHSLVGDMGTTLSGGQRQRLLLARALYRGPRMLYLDEGTANLDGHTEVKVADVIRALPITRVLIAHRPALVERSDRVILVSGGMLQEMSPPEHMLEAAE